MNAIETVSASLIHAARGVLDIVLPPQCLACDALVLEPGALCGACIRARPAFERARAVFTHKDVSRDLVTGLKHRDRLHGAPAFGRWLARVGRELIADANIIAPVPLHRLCLWRRWFNQSALPAMALAPEAGTPSIVIPDLLLRTRATPTKGGLNASQRRCNVRGTFAVNPRYADRIAGARVLLVDDVYTTGATLEA